jgi:hypothetical protein
MAPEKPSQQKWRTPLREGLAQVAVACHAIYDREAPGVLRDPETALANFGSVIGAGAEAVRDYGAAAAKPALGPEGIIRATELLEMERGALRTLTSCAWFFDDIGGIEPLQVLRYAAWAIELTGSSADRIEQGLLSHLTLAESNVRTLGTGKDIHLQRARPPFPEAVRIAAGLAVARGLAPHVATSPTWELSGPDDDALLTNCRTGRSYKVRMVMERRDLDVRVTAKSPFFEGSVLLTLPELPDRQRSAVSAVLRGEILARHLEPAERAAVARGDDLKPILRRALVRRIHSLAEDHSDANRRTVLELLTMLEGLGQAAPFEVQTQFYRVWQAGDRRDGGMAELAKRLGFVV